MYEDSIEFVKNAKREKKFFLNIILFQIRFLFLEKILKKYK